MGEKTLLVSDLGIRFLDPNHGLQQAFVRAGLGYSFNKACMLQSGYAYFHTLSSRGVGTTKVSDEQRIWQLLILQQNWGRLMLEHRLRLEERLIAIAHLPNEDMDYRFQLRGGYRLKLTFPLNKPTILPGTCFLTLQSEYMQVLESARLSTDQLRVASGIGWQFSALTQGHIGYQRIVFWPDSYRQKGLSSLVVVSVSIKLKQGRKW